MLKYFKGSDTDWKLLLPSNPVISKSLNLRDPLAGELEMH